MCKTSQKCVLTPTVTDGQKVTAPELWLGGSPGAEGQPAKPLRGEGRVCRLVGTACSISQALTACHPCNTSMPLENILNQGKLGRKNLKISVIKGKKKVQMLEKLANDCVNLHG